MKIGFIGIGNMGGSILKGYAKSAASAGNEILVHDRMTENNHAMAEAIAQSGYTNKHLVVCNDNKELAEASDIIIIGVKPAVVGSVLKEIAPATDKIIISMAAGVSIAKLEAALNEAVPGSGRGAKLIRIMPNTPARVGAAMTAMCRNFNVSDEDFALAKTIFDSVGMAEGGVLLLLLNKAMRPAAHFLYTWKLGILVVVVLLSIVIHRPFCKYVCPLGAFYGLFHRSSFLRLRCDESRCVHCGLCARSCKMQVDPSNHPDSAECIRCGECVTACPVNALSLSFKQGKKPWVKKK